jgi:subtilisin family serine protease
LQTAESADGDISLALRRVTDEGDGRQLVAISRQQSSRRAAKLVATLRDGVYELIARPADQSTVREPDPGTRVEVTTPTHRLVPNRPGGSISVPASVPGVVGVGVATDDGVAPYSGRGPTVDGRVGVDLVAPPHPWTGHGSPGTSAAAARVAGTAALVCDVLPDASPSEVTALLRASAGDVDTSGPDERTGWGRLDTLAAVQRARAR